MAEINMYKFSVGQGKNIIPVTVHLDHEEEPNQQEVVDELVKYISVFEKITWTCKTVNTSGSNPIQTKGCKNAKLFK